MDLDRYQMNAQETDQRPGTDEAALMFPVIGLASEIGSLLRHVKKRLRDRDAHELFADQVAEELGDILWYSASIATKLGLRLNDVAASNLAKVRGRWPRAGEQELPQLLDESFPPTERLPRSGSVTFKETIDGGRAVVRLFAQDSMQLGDQLTDNAYEDDGYRFHDVFHLTHAALLGWSPVTRFFFKCKRSSDARVREVEDGGRATVLEEGISALVFEYARRERFLEGVEQVDFSLLQTVTGMVSRLEVASRTAYDWERAILRGYAIWREMRRHGGGTVRFDLIARSISYEARI